MNRDNETIVGLFFILIAFLWLTYDNEKQIKSYKYIENNFTVKEIKITDNKECSYILSNSNKSNVILKEKCDRYKLGDNLILNVKTKD